MDVAGLNVERVVIEPEHAQFDLACQAGEADEQLSFEWQYNTDLFDRATIERLSGHFRTLLAAIVADPETGVDELPLMSGDEHRQIAQWNETGSQGPGFDTIHSWFERQVAATPDAIAVSAAGRRLTYAQLNRQSNQLARHLQRLRGWSRFSRGSRGRSHAANARWSAGDFEGRRRLLAARSGVSTAAAGDDARGLGMRPDRHSCSRRRLASRDYSPCGRPGRRSSGNRVAVGG